MKLAGLYLAAGASSRLGRRKQDELWDPVGGRLGGAGLKVLADCGLGHIAAVVRPEDPLEWMPEDISRRESADGSGSLLSVIPCKEAVQGMSYSIKCGLRALSGYRPDAVLIALSDQPFVTAEWLRRLIMLYEGAPVLDYAASSAGETVMPPVLLSWRMCEAAVEGLKGDRGAGSLIASGEFRGRVLEGPNPAHLLFDVDTEEDLTMARLLYRRR